MRTAVCWLLATLAAAAAAGAGAQPAASAAAASAPAFRASAPKQPTPPAPQALERTRVPGDLKPVQPAVPQIAVPLRRDAPPAPLSTRSAARPASGQVDDSAARCLALESPQERIACQRRAASAPPLPQP